MFIIRNVKLSWRAPFGLLLALVLFTGLACRAVTGGINLAGGVGGEFIRGNGEVITEERTVGGFTRVDLAGIGDLRISLGDTAALVVEGESNILPHITTVVQGSTLVIGIEPGINPSPTERLVYNLTVQALEGIEVSGLGSVEAPALEAQRFDLSVSGGGNIDLEALTANSLSVNLSGLGDINVNGGQVQVLDVNLSGGGNYNGDAMQSETTSVNVSGLGSSTVWVTGDLDVNISGAGDVKYRGEPTSITQNISGLGNLEKIE